MIDTPEELARVHRAAQAEAEILGEPVLVKVQIMNGGTLLGVQDVWVYPLASFDQWQIIDGKPVRRT